LHSDRSPSLPRWSSCFEAERESIELRAELATKEFVRAQIGEVRVEFVDARVEIGKVRAELKHNALLLKILIGITVFGLTLFNPAFVKFVELVMK
jgi:hypothetical protein